MEYLSKQRYDEIAAELKHLIYEVYPKVTDDLAEASAQGDRSDNAGDTVKRGECKGRPSAGSVSCRRSWSIPA